MKLPKIINPSGEIVEITKSFILLAEEGLHEDGEKNTVVAYYDNGNVQNLPSLLGLFMVEYGRRNNIDVDRLQLMLQGVVDNLPATHDLVLNQLFKDAVKDFDKPETNEGK